MRKVDKKYPEWGLSAGLDRRFPNFIFAKYHEREHVVQSPQLYFISACQVVPGTKDGFFRTPCQKSANFKQSVAIKWPT